jgi:aminoglycoside phosphotransferase (APT) family kinase protein
VALKNILEPAAVREALGRWLPAVLGAERVDVLEVEVPHSNGMSSETVLLETTCDGTARGLVLRVAPGGEGLFRRYDLSREARVMNAVAEHTAAPAPRVLGHEQTGEVLGAPFLLMERSYGQVPSDDPPYVTSGWVTELAESGRARMYDNAIRAIAQVQTLDPIDAGLGDLAYQGFGSDVVEQGLGYWRDFYQWAADGRPIPTIDRTVEWLSTELPSVVDGPIVVSWGDSRFGNFMFGPDQAVTGLFDWEMAELGRPEVDLAFLLFTDQMYSAGMGLPRLGGFPSREDAIARFESLSGRGVRDLTWFEAYAGLRAAVMVMRVANVLIGHGMLPADAAMPHCNPATKVLAQLLGLPDPEGEAGWIAGR